jgi:hypothetical protein
METRKFKLGCLVTVSAYTVVEAFTLEEAIEIAEEREMVIGGIGTGTDQNEQWIVDEVDGEPMGITSRK